MNTIDKEIAQIIENNLFSDSKEKLINFFGEEQYQFLLGEIFEYSVLSNNETVLNSLLGKASYLIETFNKKDALYKISKDLAKLYFSGFASKDLMRLVKGKNAIFESELKRLKDSNFSQNFQRNIVISELEGALLETDLDLSDDEIERALIFFERQYWKNRFKKIDKELGDGTPAKGAYIRGLQSFIEEEPMTMKESSIKRKFKFPNFRIRRHSMQYYKTELPESNKTKIIILALLVLLSAFLLWYFILS